MSLEIGIKTRTEKRHGIKMSNPSPTPHSLTTPTTHTTVKSEMPKELGEIFKFILGIEFVGMSQRDNFSISAPLAGNHMNYFQIFPTSKN